MATQHKRLVKPQEAAAPVDVSAPAPDILVTEGTAKFHKLRQGSPNVLLYGKSKQQQQLQQHRDPQQLHAPKATEAAPFHQHTTSNRYGPLQQSVLTARRNRLREARDPLPQSAAAKVHATSSGLRHGTRSNKYVRFPDEDILLVQPTQFAPPVGGGGRHGRETDDEAQRERHQQFDAAHESDSTLTNNASTNKSLHGKDNNFTNSASSAAKRKNVMWYRYTDYHGDIEQLKRHGHGLNIREASPSGSGGGVMSGSDARLMMSSGTTAESKADSNTSSAAAVPRQYLIPFNTRFDYMSRKVPIVTKGSILGEQTHWDWDEEAKRNEARNANKQKGAGSAGLDDGEEHAIEALMEAFAPASQQAKGGGIVRQWEGEGMNQNRSDDGEEARGRLHPHSLEGANTSSNNNNNANIAYAFVNGADGRRRAVPKSGQDSHLPSRMAALNSTNTVPPHEHLTAKISRDIRADLHAAEKNKWRAAPFTRQHRLWPLSLERDDEFAEGAVSEQEELEEREEKPREGVMNKEAAEPMLFQKRDLPEDVADGWEARWGGWGGPAEPVGKQRQAEMIANVRHLQHLQQRQQHHRHHHHHRHEDKSQRPHEHLRSRSPSGPRQYFYVPREDSASEFATRDTAVASPYSPRPMAPPSSPDGHQQVQFYAHEPVTGMLHQQFLSPFSAVAAAEAGKEASPAAASQLARQGSNDALPQHYHRTALAADTPKKRRYPRAALAASDMFRHNSYTLPQAHNHNGEGGGASPAALRNGVNGRSPKQLRRQAKQKRLAADAALEQKMRAAELTSSAANDPRQAQRNQHLLELQKHYQLQQERRRNGHHLPESRRGSDSHQSYNKYAMPGLSVTPGDRIAALKYAVLVPPKGCEVGGANALQAQPEVLATPKPTEYSVADEIESEDIVNGLFHMVRARRGQQTRRHDHDHERNVRRHRNNKK